VGTKLSTASTLSGRDWWTFAQAWVLLLIVQIGLRTLSFSRLRRFLGLEHAKPLESETDDSATADRIRRLVSMAARNHVVSMTCLPRALALEWLLRRRGISAELRIGVQRGDDGVVAHAWVECQGRAVGEPGDVEERYSPLLRVG
jgi:hypothetical protein